MATTRSAGLHGLTTIAHRHGHPPGDLVRAVGLDPAVLDHDDIPVADHRLAALLGHAAHRLDLPDLGLRMATEHNLGMLGPVAALLANSPTGGSALRSAVRYLPLHADAMRLTHAEDCPGVFTIGLRWIGVDQPPVQAMDAALGFLHRAMILLLGAGYGLIEVRLNYRPAAPAAAYEEFFGAPVTAGASSTLRVAATVLDLPVAGADEAARREAEALLAALSPAETDLLGQVRRIVRELLRYGPVPLTAVAGALALHPRTLQRRLDARGAGFAALVDAVRRDEARRLLAETTMPMGDVSARLGFAEQATLTRACHRWFSVSPRRVRGAEVVVHGQDRWAVPATH